MAVYAMADIEIVDPVMFEQYRRLVPATIAAYGGRYLARGGATEVIEGNWSPGRCIILEFPDMDTFRAWWSSPEYRPLREIREQSARTNLVVTQGVAG